MRSSIVDSVWDDLARGILRPNDLESSSPPLLKEDLIRALGVDDDEEIYHCLRLDMMSVVQALYRLLKTPNFHPTQDDMDVICARLRLAYRSKVTDLDDALYDINRADLIPLVRAVGLTELNAFVAFIRSAEEIEEEALLDLTDAAKWSSEKKELGNKGLDTEACRKAAIQQLFKRRDLRRVRRLLESHEALLAPATVSRRRIACQIHQLIEFPKWIFQSVIDTPEFQRLRRIKQLGACTFVYPVARHTRFEHSLGVGYLAEKFWNTLLQTSHLNSRCHEMQRIGTCLTIAGLCHDLGHGPFSHTFEATFANKGRQKNPWRHEDMSIKLLDRICDSTEEISDDERRCIQRMIQGDVGFSLPGVCDDPVSSARCAMYTIVANKKSGVDVDRFDYLVRDARVADSLPTFQAGRIMEFARIIDGEICFSIKEARNVLDMFTTRFRLFQEVYMHRKVRAVEAMICDILEVLEPVLDIRSRIDDPEDFLTLDDSLFDTGVRFMRSSRAFQLDPDTSEAIAKATAILDRLDRRDIYGFGGEMSVTGTFEETENIRSQFTPESFLAVQPANSLNGRLLESDIILDWAQCDHGTGRRSPMELVGFFNPNDLSRKVSVHPEVNRKWFSCFPRVYCRRNDMTDQLRETFARWQASYVPAHNRSTAVHGAGPKEAARSPMASRLLNIHQQKLNFPHFLQQYNGL